MASVLITGGSGLIGSFLAENLTITKKIIVLIREKPGKMPQPQSI
jgi:nucleoside-diphosphate-sugar epimerase